MLSVFLIFSGCAGERPVVLYSDAPEIGVAVEVYNALNDVNIILENSPLAVFDADLLIRRDWGGGSVPRFRNLQEILDFDRSDEIFVPGTLPLTYRNGDPVYSLPVAFYPSFYLYREEGALLPDSALSVTFEQLSEMDRSYRSRLADNSYWRMGYHPLWSDRSIDDLLLYFRIEHLNRGEPDSLIRLGQLIDFLRLWGLAEREVMDPQPLAEEFSAAERFHDKYFLIPPFQLLEIGRIAMLPVEFGEYHRLTSEQRERMRLLYLSSDNMLMASKALQLSVVRSDNPETERFIRWLFSVDGQEAIIRYSLENNSSLSVLFGGFSTLSEVNRTILPRYYPELENAVPEQRFLLFPPDSEYLDKERLSNYLSRILQGRNADIGSLFYGE